MAAGFYTVQDTGDGWEARNGGILIGRRPKKEPAKRLCEQNRGRELDWHWDAKTRTYSGS